MTTYLTSMGMTERQIRKQPDSRIFEISRQLDSGAIGPLATALTNWFIVNSMASQGDNFAAMYPYVAETYNIGSPGKTAKAQPSENLNTAEGQSKEKRLADFEKAFERIAKPEGEFE